MKIVLVKHNKIFYQFRLMEKSKQILIIKGDEIPYRMTVGRRGYFECSCPGSKYHGRCWHQKILGALFKQPRLGFWWDDIAEQALDVGP